jgi:hypothetical protein
MKITFYKKIFFLPLFIFIWQILILPIKSFALDYVPLEGKAFEDFGGANTAGDLTTFLSQVFSFGLALATALAVIMIVWGGVKIMLTESVFEKDDGKEKIKNAIYGLLLALVSWLILYTINPDLLNFNLFNS